MTESTEAGAEPQRRAAPAWQKALLWGVTVACFAVLYRNLSGAAAREELDLFSYLGGIFSRVSWWQWLAYMVPYSFIYFLIDAAVVWRIINWFNTRVHYLDILPIAGSSYVLSLVNEQARKGAMALYLYRRDGTPGWEVGSSMVFMMFCEMLTLLTWATIGVFLSYERLSAPDSGLQAFLAIPWIALAVGLFFIGWVLFFTGRIAPGAAVRQQPLFKAFREAGFARYLGIVALRSPAILAAVAVYTFCIRLFGIEAGVVDMLGFAPVVFFAAAIPTPMRATAILAWPLLYPSHPGEAAIFGVVQHNFFILFNAVIGLFFYRRASRELFGETPPSAA
ncbi:MAG: hypothetical protein MJE66_03215 [Proteobacteria bacterium]|nr:hypothetical protein [Pseudomonadota bacterium]